MTSTSVDLFSPAVSSSTVAPSASTNGQAPAISSLRATKRKLDDAMQSLDNAVNRPEPDDAPPAPKKARYSTRGSLYSTLAKYGIKSKDPKERPSASMSKADVLTKSTPHLTAILARTATRTRKALPFKFNARTPMMATLSPLQATSEYRPSSTRSFLARLATYKLSTYANKPSAIDAVAASKCGWVNDGKDRLVCGICSVSWVVTGRDGMNRDAANALVEKQRVSLIEMHKPGCPWKTKQCDDSIYCIPLQTPAVMAREIQKNALALEPLMQGIEIKHPLTSNQVQSLRSALCTIELSTPTSPPQGVSSAAPDTITSASAAETPTVSDTAQLTSFFGWAPAPLPPGRPRISSLTRDRASSITPSTPHTPSLSRAASVSVTRAPADTNGSASRSIPLCNVFRFESPLPSNAKRDTSLLHCSLCQRRIGLWAFAPPPNTVASASNPDPESDQTQRRPQQQRQFDLLKEHRSYCPYVVRSTIVPSLQTALTTARAASSTQQLTGANGALEGWRAVLTIVLRFGMGQRQRMGISAGGPPSEEGGEMQINGVEAMMAGVKSRGGKELLKYVKGLLG